MIDFQHQQSAHCESGAISALLRHAGLPISEPMAFGLSAAMTFAYIPLVKIGGLPLISYRMPPGLIIRGLCKRLGVQMREQRFGQNREAGRRTLDELLAAGRPVGLQTSVFWLPYFPEDMRFHFNAHNLVAYDRVDDGYLISDPTFEQPVISDVESLQRARFVRGALAPKGKLYYPESLPKEVDYERQIPAAIKRMVFLMLKTPLPIIGIPGIRHVSNKIESLAGRDEGQRQQNLLFIGHMVRMQEEIGTGGAGFRFLYAAFLQEASELLNNPSLAEMATRLTAAGDEWRRFALYAAKMCKGRKSVDYTLLAEQLRHCASLEDALLRDLRRAV